MFFWIAAAALTGQPADPAAAESVANGAGTGNQGAEPDGLLDVFWNKEGFHFTSVGFLIELVVIALALWLCHWFLLHRTRDLGEEKRFHRRIIWVSLLLAGFLLTTFLFPLDWQFTKPFFGVLTLLLTLAVALSSTTFVSNAMAGLMLRGVRSFRTGDFIRVGEQFGRVSERGLFHTEIQTEDRDLVTLPNLYLVTNPVQVVRHSGTVVSANVSLGYDVPHSPIVSLLLEAARGSDLQDPFVQILKLGDYSVTYRVAGMLTEVKQLLSVRSKLRVMALTTLHGAGIEIASPQIMIQRRLREDQRILPPDFVDAAVSDDGDVPEEKLFDKADEAERAEQLRMDREELAARIAAVKTQLKTAEEDQRARLEKELAQLQRVAEDIEKTLESADGGDGELQ
jgi:small-conductance mechanosensitive channel